MTISPPITSLPLADIGELDASDYVGLIDDAAVECLKVRLQIEGLETPVWVRRNGNRAATKWSIIAGRHRVRAARALGWTEIASHERAGPDSVRDELMRLQLVENLDRRVMKPIERALSIMCRWRAVATDNAWDIVSQARDADEATAEACGVDGRTIRRYRRIFDALVTPFQDDFARMNAHPLGASLSAMTQLASLKLDKMHTQRRMAVEKLLERDDWPNMSAVLEAAGIKESNGNRTEPNARLYDSWSRASLKERKAHVEWLADQVTPSMAIDMVARFKERGVLP